MPSRRWIMEQAKTVAAVLEGLPCGVAHLILDEANTLISLVSAQAATSTEFRLDACSLCKRRNQ
jgi:hypothetical protein